MHHTSRLHTLEDFGTESMSPINLHEGSGPPHTRGEPRQGETTSHGFVLPKKIASVPNISGQNTSDNSQTYPGPTSTGIEGVRLASAPPRPPPPKKKNKKTTILRRNRPVPTSRALRPPTPESGQTAPEPAPMPLPRERRQPTSRPHRLKTGNLLPPKAPHQGNNHPYRG